MEIYLVGGAVRDQLLRLPVNDRDWVVVGATPEMLRTQGYRQPDASFPVFIHPTTGEEYALARRETKTAPGYKGFKVDAGSDVTLEEDLKRRDLTINALAQTPDGQIIDPFGGQRDLQSGILRHISPAFSEDPLRLLRLARFAARLGRYGFHVAHATQKLLVAIVASGELAALPNERIWRELELALAADSPSRFFTVLWRCGALAALLPEVAAALGAPGAAHTRPQAEMLTALDRAAQMQVPPPVRWGIVALAVSQAGGMDSVEQLNHRLAVPTAFRDAAVQMAAHTEAVRTVALDDPDSLLALFDRMDTWRRPQRLGCVLSGLRACAATPEARAQAERREQRLDAARQAAARVTGAVLQARGIRSGVEFGRVLRTERLAAIRAWLGVSGAD